MALVPRPYQVAAEDAAFAHWRDGARSVLFVCPTGGGKSLFFSRVIQRFYEATGLRALLVADRDALVKQGAENAREHTGLQVGIEMGAQRVETLFMPPVVAATIQTIGRKKRLERFRPDDFGLIVFDEADLSLAPAYRKVEQYFGGAKLLGVTATPKRADGQALGLLYEQTAGVVEIRDLIEDGYLVNIRGQSIGEVDVSFVARQKNGDLDDEALGKFLSEDLHLYEVVIPTLEKAGDRPTIVFGATVEHAKELARVFNERRPGCARAIHGEMDDDQRRDIIDPFIRGDYQFLVNCALLTRGVDIPKISCVVIARPMTSDAMLKQCVGRGTRTLKGVVDGLESAAERKAAIAASAKQDLLILDLAGIGNNLSLVTPLNVLDGTKDPDVIKRARALLKKNPEQMILDAIDEAARQLAEEKRKALLAKARYTTTTIDPFSMVQTFLGITPRAGRWGGRPPAPEDLAYLAKAAKGLDVRGLDGGQVREIALAVKRRYTIGRASFNQARVLIRKGLDPDVSAAAAQLALDTLAANEWEPTGGLRAAFALVSQQRGKLVELEGEGDAGSRVFLAAQLEDIDARRKAAFAALRRGGRGQRATG